MQLTTQSVARLGCMKQDDCSSDGCHYCISQWKSEGGDLYAATRWLHPARQGTLSLPTEEITLRVEASTLLLEPQVREPYETHRIPPEWCRSMCLCAHWTEQTMCAIAVYVNDIVLLTNTEAEKFAIKKQLKEGFKMNDPGKLHYLLSITVQIKDGTVTLDQHQYLTKLLEKFGLQDAKEVSTPLDPNIKLVKEDNYSTLVDPMRYQSPVGSRLYTAMATRADIAHAVGVLSRFSASPNKAHNDCCKTCVPLLSEKNSGPKIDVHKAECVCETLGYSDADLAGQPGWQTLNKWECVHDRRSSCELAQQTPSYCSSVNSRGRVCSTDINIPGSCLDAPPATDSGTRTWVCHDLWGQSGVNQDDTQPVLHSRTKHIDIRYHYIRETVAEGTGSTALSNERYVRWHSDKTTGKRTVWDIERKSRTVLTLLSSTSNSDC